MAHEELHPKAVEALELLAQLGIPSGLRDKVRALVFLSLCGIGPDDEWSNASAPRLSISRGMADFIAEKYGVEYKENSREQLRKDGIYSLLHVGIVSRNPDNPSLSPNSQNSHYALTEEALAAIRAFKTSEWENLSTRFCQDHGLIVEKYAKARNDQRVAITLPNGEVLDLSPGVHNVLQKAIVEDFRSRFAKDAEVLYLGDTEMRTLYTDEAMLTELRIPIASDTKLPDVVMYSPSNKWLFLIEAVASGGPVSEIRKKQLEKVLSELPKEVGVVYVTAFPDVKMFRKFSSLIAWETEAWIMDMPHHMVHFNGERFLGPHK